MIYTCPKCNADAQIDHSILPADESNATCRECSARFWIYKESFARRALKKEGTIFCSSCGNELDHLIICRSCGVRYPDYFLIQMNKIVRKQPKVIKEIALPTLKTQKSRKSASATDTKTVVRPKKQLFLVLGMIAILAIFAAGYNFYTKMKDEEQYTINFFRVVYAAKLGVDSNSRICAKIVADTNARIAAGQTSNVSITAEDGIAANNVKADVDKLKGRLIKTPKKYKVATEKLEPLYAAYSKFHTLTVSASGPLPLFTEAVSKAEADFKTVSNDFKSTISQQGLQKEFDEAKAKYKALKDF